MGGGGTAWRNTKTLGFTRWVSEPFDLSPVELSILGVPVIPGNISTGLVLHYQNGSLLVKLSKRKV